MPDDQLPLLPETVISGTPRAVHAPYPDPGGRPLPLNATHLLTLVVVAELRSLSRAAVHLNLSQPAVSTHLRQLQAQVGEALFRRTGHGVVLTAAGEALLPYAQDVARSLARAETFLEDRQGHPTSEASLGVCWTLSERLPPELQRAFAQTQPGTSLRIHVGTTADLTAQVASGTLLAALTAGQPGRTHEDLQVRHAGTDELVWVEAAGSRAPDTPVSFAQTAHRPWLWAQPQSSVRLLVETRAQDLGLLPAPALDLGSYAGVRQALIAGMGGAFMPRHLIQAEVSLGVLTAHRLADLDLLLPYRLLLPPARRQSALSRALVGTSLATLDRLLSTEGP